MRLLLLPGLDGTGFLFEPLLRVLPLNIEATTISYPATRGLGYQELFAYVSSQLPSTAPYVLVAESFSGPLAIAIAHQRPEHLQAVVLCASFLHQPVSKLKALLAHLLGRARFNVRPPVSLVRRYLLGPHAATSSINKFYSAIATVPFEILFERIKNALAVDVREQFYHLQLPVLWLYAAHDKLLKNPYPAKELRQNSNCVIKASAAPHLLFQTKPEQACAAIQIFLNDITN